MKRLLFILVAIIVVSGLIMTGCAKKATLTPTPTPSQKLLATAAISLGARYAPTTQTKSGIKIHIYFDNQGDYCFIELTNTTTKNLIVEATMRFKRQLIDPKNPTVGGPYTVLQDCDFGKIALNPSELWQTKIEVPKQYQTEPENEYTKICYESGLWIIPN